MIFATDISNGVNAFLKTKISLNKQFEQYSFQGKWTSEIDESYFDNQITKLQNDLLVRLKSGKNNVQFLADLLDIILSRIEWINENKIHKFSFIEDIEHKNINLINEMRRAILRYFIK